MGYGNVLDPDAYRSISLSLSRYKKGGRGGKKRSLKRERELKKTKRVEMACRQAKNIFRSPSRFRSSKKRGGPTCRRSLYLSIFLDSVRIFSFLLNALCGKACMRWKSDPAAVNQDTARSTRGRKIRCEKGKGIHKSRGLKASCFSPVRVN